MGGGENFLRWWKCIWEYGPLPWLKFHFKTFHFRVVSFLFFQGQVTWPWGSYCPCKVDSIFGGETTCKFQWNPRGLPLKPRKGKRVSACATHFTLIIPVRGQQTVPSFVRALRFSQWTVVTFLNTNRSESHMGDALRQLRSQYIGVLYKIFSHPGSRAV